MKTSRTHMVAMSVGLAAAGCMAEPIDSEEEHLASAEQAFEILNGNDPVFFWKSTTQSWLFNLSQGALTDGNGNLASTLLSTSDEEQRLLGYVIGCALPFVEGEPIEGPGGPFYGAAGLAPEWATGALSSATSQKWVTACLLQTLNGLGAEVNIWLSGNHPAIDDDPVSPYTVHDATMFGNLFVSNGRKAYACTDVGLINACGLSAGTATLERICGLSPSCGITLLGPCSLYCTAGTCSVPLGSVYPESISSTLEESVAVSLFPGCSF